MNVSRPQIILIASILAFGLLFGAGCAGSDAPAEPAKPQVQAAETFVDSIGVDTHLGYTGTVYYRFHKIEKALKNLGVHYIRDGIAQGATELDARYRALGAMGIKLDALVGDPRHESGVGTIAQQLSVIEKDIGPNMIASLENPNEYDNAGVANWLPQLRSWIPRLWRSAKARPKLKDLPIIGPSFVSPTSREELGDVSQWTTYGNMHPYPGGAAPDENAHLESELELAAINTPGQPVQATETGYTTAINSTNDQPPISERAEGIYMPRLLLENFRRGIVRTYIYELIDLNADPGLDEAASNFGLLRHDYTPKPAYRAVQNLIAILSDPGPAFTPEMLDYELEGAPAETREVLLQKRNGDYYLALWNPVSIWNTQTLTEKIPPPTQATVKLAQPVSKVSVYQPNLSKRPIRTRGQTRTIAVPIGPRVTILQLAP